jgi:hypothetical protein
MCECRNTNLRIIGFKGFPYTFIFRPVGLIALGYRLYRFCCRIGRLQSQENQNVAEFQFLQITT